MKSYSQHQEDETFEHCLAATQDIPSSPRFIATRWRWISLLVCSLALLGDNYIFAAAFSMEPILHEPPYSLSYSQYNMLLSVMSLPNMIIPLFVGRISDFIGERICMTMMFVGILLSQASFTYGLYLNSFPLMVVGRVLACCSDANFAIHSSVTSKWFGKSQNGVAMATMLAISQLGSVFNSILSPIIRESTSQAWKVGLAGCYVALGGFAFEMLFIYLDYRYRADNVPSRASVLSHPEATHTKDDGFISAIKSFNKLYWITTVLLGLYVCTAMSLLNQVNDLYYKRFGLTKIEAGYIAAVTILLSSIISPPFGYLVDRYGCRISSLFVVGLVFLIAHLQLALLPNTEDPSMLICFPVLALAVHFVAATSILPSCIAIIVPERSLGLAFGLVYCLKSGIQTVMSMILGGIQESSEEYKYGYFYSEMLLALISVIVLAMICYLYKYDQKSNRSALSLPTRKLSSSHLLGQKDETELRQILQ